MKRRSLSCADLMESRLLRARLGQLPILRGYLEQLCFRGGVGLPFCKLTATACLLATVLDAVETFRSLNGSCEGSTGFNDTQPEHRIADWLNAR